MSVKFKFDKSPSQILNIIRDQLDTAIDTARLRYAEFLHEELRISSPEDTSTFGHSWMVPTEIEKGFAIVNRLPSHYIGNGFHHSSWEPIIDPYNIFILEGNKKGAPSDFNNALIEWTYINRAEGKLQDVNLMLWKFNQGALGLNPYTTLNELFSKAVRRNI